MTSCRITADDFVTPPEFAGLSLARRSAGQIGGVRLELIVAGDCVRWGRCYQQVPVRVLPPFHFAAEPAALIYLINPTAGLLDGDGQLMELTVGAGVCAVVTGQSATRIHPAVNSFCTQQWRIRVETGACLVVLPGPAIPFQRCRYYQRVRVDLAAQAQFLWSDIWFPGRYARGELSERFQFERIVQDLEVRREGELVFRDRFCWSGPWTPEQTRWHLGPHEASASLFVTGPPGAVTGTRNDQLQRVAFPLAAGDACVRWCGRPSELVRDLVPLALLEAARRCATPEEAPWLLSSGSLAPNHWFST